MGTEIEKKYRLNEEERESLRARLPDLAAAVLRGEESEENILFSGPVIDPQTQVLRLRIVGERAILTYKERFPSASAISRQREDETTVSSPAEMIAILDGIGYRPALVYEKRRQTWSLGEQAELVIDELPFGLFAEIEGEEQAILEAEKLLGLQNSSAEMKTYPELAATHGTKVGDMIEARFQKP